jgi:glycosyltransferase involved in cell wall biosynthesis
MVITELDEGGAEKAFVRIAHGLHAKAWNVHAVSLRNPGPLAEQLQRHGIPVTALHAHHLTAPLALPRLTKVLKAIQPIAVLSFLHQANIVSRIAATLARVPCHLSGIRVADHRLRVRLPEYWTQRLTSHYIACSETVALEHARLCRIPQTRFSIIRNGVDVDSLLQIPAVPRRSLTLLETDFVVLSAGRLTAQKAPHLLLDALRLLQRKQLPKRIRLLFAGEGPLRRKLEQLAASLPDPSAVQFLGWRNDLPGLMKSADLLVLPSAWEGLPNVLLEAHAVGLPAAAAAVDGCIDALQHGDAGRLFPPNDPHSIASLIEDQLRNPLPTLQLAHTAQETLQKTGRWEHCIDRCHTILQQLIQYTSQPPEIPPPSASGTPTDSGRVSGL